MGDTVLICCNVYPPRFIGGAELIAHYQAKELQRRGYRVIVFAGDTKPQRQRHDMCHENYDDIDVYRVYLTHQDYNHESVNFIHPQVEAHFQGILERYRPRVVHFHNIIGLSVAIVGIAKRWGARTILTVHDYWGFCFKNTLIKREGEVCKNFAACAECLPSIRDDNGRTIPIALRQDYFALMLSNIDAFVSPSEYVAQTYIAAGFPQEKFHIVWNGIDVERFSALRKKPASDLLRLSFFGYFGKHKGVQTLLQVLPLVADRQRLRINLIGDGDQKQIYKGILESNGCAHLVRFWGKLDNREVEMAYAETDVLVLPSIWHENQPVSITEAMAARIPVIASRMGGIPELIEDGVSGFLFEAGDSAQLAAIIQWLLDSPELVETLGENAYLRIAQHSFSAQIGRLLDIYHATESGTAVNLSQRVVVCIGQHFDSVVAQAIAMTRAEHKRLGIRIVHADWCDESLWSKAWLCWVTDRKMESRGVEQALGLGIPLLVPEDSLDLAELCRKGHCGLYYGDEQDAWGCIEYLLEHPDIYFSLSANAPGAAAYTDRVPTTKPSWFSRFICRVYRNAPNA